MYTEVKIAWKSFVRTLNEHALKIINFKGVRSGLRQILATESPLKIMSNAFHFTFKALFFLKLFKSLSWISGHVEKQLNLRDEVNLKLYDVTAWLTNNCNTHTAQYL